MGFGTMADDAIFAGVNDVKTSSMTNKGVNYDTYYFGMTKEKSENWTKTNGTYTRTGYIAFKDSDALTYVFTVHFEITPADGFLSTT